METNRVFSGSTFESDMSYSRAVIDDTYIHISGTTGFNYDDMTLPESVVEQAEQCFKNIQKALEEAGSTLQDIVRVRYIFPEREDFQKCWPIFKKYLGNIKPAATMIVAGLFDERMKVEIEVTAKRSI